MSFSSQEEIVEKWLKSHSDVQLIFADETESSFQFATSRPELSSFVVKCPESKPEKWASRKTQDALPDDEEEDEDNDDDDYYGFHTEYDEEAPNEPEDKRVDDDLKRWSTTGSPFAVSRLIKDMKNLQSSEGKYGISGAPRGDNIFIWDVQLSDFTADTKLGRDLKDYAKKYNTQPVIQMEMLFPDDYPLKPPFVRVIRPRFQFLTGHVTIGGSICLEVLTRSGWSPSNDIESILVQIRATILSDPNAALAYNANDAYAASEAREAFNRVAAYHGWN